jgi:anti-sigma factor RsiW
MMFGCDETRRYVDAWVDGELDPGASLHVETHVGRCAECRAEADMIRSLKRAMSALRETGQAPAALRSRIAAALEAEDHEDDKDEARSAQKRKHATGFVLAGAALAGFIVATGRHGAGPHDVQVAGAGMIPPVLENITEQHARDLPVEVSGSRPEQVVNFFRGRLDVPVRPVAFHGVPAQLVGARISTVQDRMAAALFYDVGGRRVTVFVFDGQLVPHENDGAVRRAELPNHQSVYIGNAHGYTVAFSEHDGVGYAVASDLPTQDTIRIVESAEIQ